MKTLDTFLNKTIEESWAGGTQFSSRAIKRMAAERKAAAKADRAKNKKATSAYDAWMKEKVKLAKDPFKGYDPNVVMMQIDDAIGQSFPDGDPFDFMARKYPRLADNYSLGDMLSAVTKKFHKKGFSDYWEEVYDQHKRDMGYMGEAKLDPKLPWRIRDGKLFEKDIQVGSVKLKNGQYTVNFFTEKAQSRFENFADTLSTSEKLEMLKNHQ